MERRRIGRTTLYKYFAGVEEILVAWHQRQVGAHLDQLAEVAGRPGDARERLEAVLHAYASIVHEHHGTEPAAVVHERRHLARAHRQLGDLVRGLLTEAAAAGDVRDDVAPRELAAYCLHALAAASGLRSRAAVGRLVEVTLAGVRSRA